jgi:large subunit ribosomal protein L18
MRIKYKKRTNKVRMQRIVRHERGRKHVNGTAEKPRLTFFKGNTTLVAQVVNDLTHKTLLGLATNSEEVKVKGKNKEAAVKLGKAIGEKCKTAGISAIVFDRSGYQYHGVVKAFADSVRETGIKF